MSQHRKSTPSPLKKATHLTRSDRNTKLLANEAREQHIGRLGKIPLSLIANAH